MTIFAYKLKRIFLNGWVDTKTMLDSIGDIDEGDEYLDGWRELRAEESKTVGWRCFEHRQKLPRMGW